MNNRFFILGAAKSGSTSLYEYLRQHSQLYFSPIKEPNFFATDINENKFNQNYRKNTNLDQEWYFSQDPLPEYHLAYITSKTRYNKLFEKAGKNQLLGEASTSYLWSSESARNIYKVAPNAKFIVILRNPIERAYSHWMMGVRGGRETLGFFEALQKDYSAKEKGRGISKLYIELGLYYEQVLRFIKLFGKDQFLFITTYDLHKNPHLVMLNVFNFLDIPVEKIEIGVKHNTGGLPKFLLINNFVSKLGIINMLRKYFPKKVLAILAKSLIGKKQPMSNEARLFLKSIYTNDIERLSELIGMDLHYWR